MSKFKSQTSKLSVAIDLYIGLRKRKSEHDHQKRTYTKDTLPRSFWSKFPEQNKRTHSNIPQRLVFLAYLLAMINTLVILFCLEFVCEAVVLSVDPYMRLFGNTLPDGATFMGEQVAR